MAIQADLESSTKPAPLAALWRTVTRFESGKTTPLLGLRNMLGVALPLAAGVALGHPGIGLVASTGALNVSFSDGGDPYHHRARRMLASSLLVGLSVLVGCTTGQDRLGAEAITVLWAFGAALLVALGPPSADLAVISLVTLVVFTAQPMPAGQAGYTGLVALAGGLLQTALALMFWPSRRYQPERLALGELYQQLAHAASQPANISTAPLGTMETTRAQETLSALAQDHSLQSERYLFLLSQAERIRLSLLALARMRRRIEREDGTQGSARLLDRCFAIASELLQSIAEWLITGHHPNPVAHQVRPLQELANRLRESRDAATPLAAALIQDSCSQLDALAGQLRSALDVANQTATEGLADFEKREARQPWTLRFGGAIATLRANLTLVSSSFRHAIRLAGCIAVSEVVGGALGWSRSYWIPMTIAIVLKPDFSSTFSRGVLRLAGTFAGLLFTTALFHLITPGPGLLVVLIAAAVFVLRGFGATNYGVLVAAVSALVVLLIALAGVDPRVTINARAWNTAAGGALALLAYTIWPTWERTQVSEALANMLDAYFRYFQTVAGAYLKPKSISASQLDRARMQARLARSNAEASVDRVATEPGATKEQIGHLAAMLASSHRLVHAVMALEAGLSSRTPVPAPGLLRPFAHQVEVTLHSLAAALRGSPLTLADLPDLREYHHSFIGSATELADNYVLIKIETDRITNSLNTLTGQVLQRGSTGLAR